MSAEIIAVRVKLGHGCEGCEFSRPGYPDITRHYCYHPNIAHRNCSNRETRDGFERIYVTPEKAALMRLRGEVK